MPESNVIFLTSVFAGEKRLWSERGLLEIALCLVERVDWLLGSLGGPDGQAALLPAWHDAPPSEPRDTAAATASHSDVFTGAATAHSLQDQVEEVGCDVTWKPTLPELLWVIKVWDL